MPDTQIQTLIQRVREELSQKTKPAGSLDRIDAIAETMAVAQRNETPVAKPATVLVFAADHGIARDGVSAYPREVTTQMVHNLAAGGAAVCTFARACGAQVEVYDVGVDADAFEPPVHSKKIARGTGNIRIEPAMSDAQCKAAITVGKQALDAAVDGGARVVAIGEMGIGNTAPASALSAAILGKTAKDLVGPGSGVEGEVLASKIEAVNAALQRTQHLSEPKRQLAELGGFEIAAMSGVCLRAKALKVPVVVDGFIATAAALAAVRIDETVASQLIWGHRSAEPGHDTLLAALNATPILDLNMRLGEGSGAVLALPILHAACTMLDEMATFGSAGVSDREEAP